jgi:hypothetical protein
MVCRSVTIVVLLVVVIQGLSPSPGHSQQEWQYGGLVLSLGPWTWNNSNIEGVNVVYDGSQYYMYYTGVTDTTPYENARIGLATSTDGVNWTKREQPVLDVYAYGSLPFYEEGQFKLWYMGVDQWGTMYVASSGDGVAWSQGTAVSGLPAHARPASVVRVGAVYHMWYSNYPGDRFTGHATSTDGVTWTDGGFAYGGGNHDFDSAGAIAPSVIYNNGVFEIWYSGYDASSNVNLGYATSIDGSQWTTFGAVTGIHSQQPSVRLENGQYKIWYNDLPCCFGVHYATSDTPVPGAISGFVTADCPVPDTPLYGVMVDVFANSSGELVKSAVTDSAGAYCVDSLSAGDYTVTIVRPLGYVSEADEDSATVAFGATSEANFVLDCVDPVGNPRGVGFWKHQIAVAIRGHGASQVDAATLCDYLDLIVFHFNSNEINEVVVYNPPDSADCDQKLLTARSIMGFWGNWSVTVRANKELMAVLLNVASNRLSLRSVVSEDGVTLSQAITFCDQLLDDTDSLNDDTALFVARRLNRSQLVAAGVIPLDTDNIAYSPPAGGEKTRFQTGIERVSPNPFNPSTTISYSLDKPGLVRIQIYDVSGRLVRTLINKPQEAGSYDIAWDGTDSQGAALASGVYFARFAGVGIRQTHKLLLLK